MNSWGMSSPSSQLFQLSLLLRLLLVLDRTKGTGEPQVGVRGIEGVLLESVELAVRSMEGGSAPRARGATTGECRACIVCLWLEWGALVVGVVGNDERTGQEESEGKCPVGVKAK